MFAKPCSWLDSTPTAHGRRIWYFRGAGVLQGCCIIASSAKLPSRAPLNSEAQVFHELLATEFSGASLGTPTVEQVTLVADG